MPRKGVQQVVLNKTQLWDDMRWNDMRLSLSVGAWQNQSLIVRRLVCLHLLNFG